LITINCLFSSLQFPFVLFASQDTMNLLFSSEEKSGNFFQILVFLSKMRIFFILLLHFWKIRSALGSIFWWLNYSCQGQGWRYFTSFWKYDGSDWYNRIFERFNLNFYRRVSFFKEKTGKKLKTHKKLTDTEKFFLLEQFPYQDFSGLIQAFLVTSKQRLSSLSI